MISKFQEIKGIGVYYDFIAQGRGHDLKRNSVIFANNGHGKSTLAAILRALKEDNPELIIERKTLGKDLPQGVIIRSTNGAYTYSNGQWSSAKDKKLKLVVFDHEFVESNLFIREVESDHRKRIYQLVMGSEGIEIAAKLNQLIQQEKEKRKVFQVFANQLQGKNASCNVSDYLAIKEAEMPEFQHRLNEIRGRLKTKENREEISKLSRFEEIEINLYPKDNLEKISEQSPETFHTDVKQKVVAHLNRHARPNASGEAFIKMGMGLLVEDCPFCGQALGSVSDLLDSYKVYFDENYTAYVDLLETEIAALRNWDFRKSVYDVQNWMNECEQTTHKLLLLAGESQEPRSHDLSGYAERFASAASQIISNLEVRLSNPSNINNNQLLADLLGIEQELYELTSQFRNHLKSIVETFQAKAKAVPSEEISIMNLEIQQLEARIQRYNPQEVEWCNAYRQTKKELETISSEREDQETIAGEYSESLLSRFKEEVNTYLENLRAKFRIDQLEGKTDGVATSAYANFVITINDQQVPLSARSGKPKFLNTLSQGDRNALGLAFFLAWLRAQPDLSEHVVVFDDPLTSMDNSRQYGTAKALSEISEIVGQLIVFTHKEDFLFQLDDELKNLHGLTISNDDTLGSQIIPIDIKWLRKDPHFRRLDEMRRYITEDFGPKVKDMQENIRTALERILRIKYYPLLEEKPMLGAMIKVLTDRGMISNDVSTELNRLNGVSSPTHHPEEYGRPIQNLERRDLIPEIEATLKLIQEL
ncbi:MAG: hypothetical protein EPO32_10265 [Anaerolineae bacterium]|nr:MAG: hypothetical protein EPO32_10265 [Anaerolineae bacterium]